VGDLETSAHICHHICASVPCCVIDVEYRLIPEYPFPIGIMDGLSAVAHILVNHKTFSIDPNNFTIGGESSGGTISLILSHILRDMGMGDKLKGVIAGTPTISDVRKYATPDMSPWPSMRESQYTPLLNWEKLKWFDTFKWMSLSSSHPGVSAKEMKKDVSWYADAMNAPDFKNLAPITWVGTAEADPLRDEAEAYAEKVRENGNRVVCKRYKGMPHGFMRLDGRLEGGREYVEDVIGVIRGCLYPVGEKVEGDEMKVEDKTAKADSRLGSEEKNDVDLQREDEDMDDAPPTEDGQ
jgi:acetyl esterase/lipase